MVKRKILVVEDDPILRKFIADVLQKRGAEVIKCENGVEALEKIRNNSFHLIVSDLKMEGMDGLELLTETKKISPSIAVVIITAYGTVSSAVEAMKKGAFDYITKPIELEELYIVVDRVFEYQKLIDENKYLKERLNKDDVTNKIIGKSQKTQRVRELVEMIGPLDTTVLIQGETGTGKEVIANAIHKISSRKDGPFIKVNCAALPDTLLESELFGHEKGAFTGAIQKSKGRFEMADAGTILLDEVGELGLPVQAKLLRVLQYHQFERIGSGKSIKVDVRVVAVTNKNLKEEVKKGNFRKDLFFRLNVVSITSTALRKRREDIPYFIEYFLDMYNKRYNKKKFLSKKAMELLVKYDWPGNVRELENCIETAIILNHEKVLEPKIFLFLEENRDLLEEDPTFNTTMTIAEAEKRLIIKTYRKMNNNKTRTAKVLGITIKTLRTKLKEYGVIESRKKS